jgi:hypothetical protein
MLHKGFNKPQNLARKYLKNRKLLDIVKNIYKKRRVFNFIFCILKLKILGLEKSFRPNIGSSN